MSNNSIQNKIEVIRNETAESGNTKNRVAVVLTELNDKKADLVDGKVPLEQLPPIETSQLLRFATLAELEATTGDETKNYYVESENSFYTFKSGVGFKKVDKEWQDSVTSELNQNAQRISAAEADIDILEATDQTLIQNFNDLNSALTTLQNWKNSLTGSDADNIINRIDEIIQVLQGLPEDANIFGLINGKVSISDIVDNLTSIDTTKPLSANSGRVLSEAITVLSNALGNKLEKGGYVGTAQDLNQKIESEITNRSNADTTIQNQVADLGTHQIIINTSASITTDTVGSVTGKGQHGRNVRINNGVNAINISCETTSNADFVASYVKLGSGAITFVAGAGATLVQVDGTAILNGAIGSTACLTRNGNTFYLQISNR